MTEGPSRIELSAPTAADPGCTDGCCAPSAATGSAPSNPTSEEPNAERQKVQARRIRVLVAATISYNVIEAIVAISAGALASSTALIGFGLDSTIEVASAGAVAWQFSARDAAVRQSRERRALTIIAVSFFVLGAYVTVEAIRSLAGGASADESTVGIVLAALSVVIMSGLSYVQRFTGRQLGSASAVADSKQTLLCSYLSGVLLVGLLLNACSAGRGPTLSWRWSSRRSRSRKAARPGAATAAAHRGPHLGRHRAGNHHAERPTHGGGGRRCASTAFLASLRRILMISLE